MAPPDGAVRGVGLDLSFEAIRLCRRRGLTRLVLGTAERLPFRSGAFGAVSCRDVLAHVPDDVKAAREIARVAATGGARLPDDGGPPGVRRASRTSPRTSSGAIRPRSFAVIGRKRRDSS